MAAYISVPRDLTKVKSKVAFNLTKRQLLCFGTAALIGVPLFFLLRDSGGNSAATLGMMVVMLPAFFLGMYEKNGQPLEKLLSHYLQARFLRPKIRPYKTNNYYALLMKGGSAHVADKLLRDGRVRLKDCRSAKGKTYNATVLLTTEADGRSKFSLEFEGSC